MAEVYSLLYVSQAAPDFAPVPGIDHIVTRSVSWNRKAGITGALIYNAGFFAQYLEGSEKHVCDLIEQIKIDPRHAALTIVQHGMRPKRLFPRWSLAFAGDAGFVNNDISRLFGGARQGRSAAAASSRMIGLMDGFIKSRAALQPTVH